MTNNVDNKFFDVQVRWTGGESGSGIDVLDQCDSM